MDDGSREYIFAIELMTSVMELYNIKWKTKKKRYYVKLSPFTPVVKKAVEYIWREKNEFIDDLFNTVISMGTINMRNYKAAVEFAGHLVTEAEYDEIELLRYCVIASGYASLFYRNGLKDVTSQCIQLIYDVIMSFRAKNEFTDESWADIEILGKAYSVASPFKEDFSNSTSACFSQLSGNNRSDNFLEVAVYPRNVVKQCASKTVHHKIRNDVESFNRHSMKNEETEKISSKLLKPKNAKNKFENTKSVKKKISDKEDADEKVSEKRVMKKCGSNTITTTMLAKNKDAEDVNAASKYITAEVKEDKDVDKPNAEQQYKSLTVEREKFKHKKITTKFKDYKAVETINEFVKFSMANNAAIGSEASKYEKKEDENINKVAIGTNNSFEGARALKATTKKLNKTKRKAKKDKRTKHETNRGMFTTPNVTPGLKWIPKDINETDKAALNSAVIVDTKKSKYNRKFAETKYLTEEMKNVKHGAQMSDTTVTVKDSQTTKNDKLITSKYNLETCSETKDEFFTHGESVENIKASCKVIAEKIKLVKYKTKKFKGKRNKNKKARRMKHKVKEAERIVNSLEDSVPTNPVEGTKYSVGKTDKEVEVIKKKTKKSKAKKNVDNKISYKEVTETMYTSDGYIDVETIDEDVLIASKKVISKKRKHNTKSVKKTNIDRTSTGEVLRPRRRSTRENIVNPLVIDLTKERQIPSTSNEIEPTWKDPNIRNPGCEISNLINVSAHESSVSIFLNKPQENTSSEIHNQEPENRDPENKSQPRDFKEVPLTKTTSSKACNTIHSRKSISGAATQQENVARNTTHSRHKSY